MSRISERKSHLADHLIRRTEKEAKPQYGARTAGEETDVHRPKAMAELPPGARKTEATVVHQLKDLTEALPGAQKTDKINVHQPKDLTKALPGARRTGVETGVETAVHRPKDMADPPRGTDQTDVRRLKEVAETGLTAARVKAGDLLIHKNTAEVAVHHIALRTAQKGQNPTSQAPTDPTAPTGSTDSPRVIKRAKKVKRPAQHG